MSRKAVFVISFICFAAGAAFANSEQPPNAKAPRGTIPYNKKLCKTAEGKEAFSFVKVKPKFDKQGCAKPLKAWVYDEKKDKWSRAKASQVTCCDPSAEAGTEP